MIKFNPKRILVPYDFSKNADKALSHATFMAKFLKCDLYLLHVITRSEIVDILMPMLKLKNNSQLEELVNEKLSESCEKIRRAFGIKVKSLVSTGNITTEIVNLCEENKIDLVVMGTQGSDSKNDLWLGSNAYRLITKSEIPVMTVKVPSAKKGYNSICLPVDLSEHTRQKVYYAINMAKAFNAKITVLGLYEENERGQKFKLETYVKQIEKLCKREKVAIESFVDKTGHRVSKTNAFAKKHNADLIITMTDQKKDSRITMLNSYDHELVHSAKVPVISIHPETSDDLDNGSTPGLPF